MAMKSEGVGEAPAQYCAAVDYEHESEDEHEPSLAPEPGLRPSSN